MAEPYQKNGRWYVRFKDGRGRWRDRATGARTKTEARRLELELSRKHERQRLGLEPLPSDLPEQTFGSAMDLWWSEHGKHLRSPTIHRFMEKHLRPELALLPLSEVGDKLEAVLNARVDTLGPESLNHLRAAVHRVYAFLTRRGAWKGANPAVAVPRFKVPKRLPRYLRTEEVLLVLAALDARWRGISRPRSTSVSGAARSSRSRRATWTLRPGPSASAAPITRTRPRAATRTCCPSRTSSCPGSSRP